jgi:hypothetical protein
MTKRQSEQNGIDHPISEIDAAAALAVKVFISFVFTAGAIVAVLAAAGFVVGVWSTMDQELVVDTAKAN